MSAEPRGRQTRLESNKGSGGALNGFTELERVVDDAEVASMEPSQFSNARLTLRATKAFSPEFANLLDEIDQMGEYSRQLIPDLIETMKRSVYIPSIPLFA